MKQGGGEERFREGWEPQPAVAGAREGGRYAGAWGPEQVAAGA